MNKKHLTYDDRLAIQAGLQQGLKVAQIAKNIGKDRSTVGREIKAHRRLVKTSGAITASTIVPVPEFQTAVRDAFVGRSSARQLVDDVRKDVLIIRKSSVQITKSRRLSVMPVTIGFAVACAGCSMMPSMLSSSMNRCSQSPGKESPSQSRNEIGSMIQSHRC